jgi:two-component system cell cycle sensor histidine kinase/response regulator CckA
MDGNGDRRDAPPSGQHELDYRSLADAAVDQIFVIGLDDRILYVNRSAAQQFRTTPERMIGRRRAEVFPPAIAAQQQRSLDHVLRTEQGLYVESAAQYLDRPVWLSTWLAPVRDAEGRITGVLGYSRDITARKRTEEALHATNERLSAVLAHAPIVLWAADGAGVVTFCSGQGLQALKLRAEDLLGRSIVDLQLPPFSLLREQMLAALHGEASHGQVTNEGLEFEAWSVPLQGPTDVPRGAISVMVDITERRRLEADLATARKLEAIGRLAGGIAHDFNNNLTVILGFTDMILEQIGGDKPISQDLVEISAAAQRAAGLVRRLLAFGRRQVLQNTVLDLNQVVGSLEQMLQRVVGERISLTLSLASDLPAMSGDAGQIEQVILNLVLNARDAMAGGGRLDIRTAPLDLIETGRDGPPGAPPGRYVSIAISDTGVGMDEYTKERLFEPFFTTKPVGDGTGLGLATAYGIVKQLGGFIWVASEIGQGSTFTMCWPALGAPAPSTIEAASPGRQLPFVSRKTILLVEDEETVRRFAAVALTRHGFRVLDVGSPEEALAIANGADAADIKLLLTDVVMPGLTGPELAGAIRQLLPDVTVAYMSGYPANAISPDGQLDPRAPLLAKPFTSAELLRHVQDALERGV